MSAPAGDSPQQQIFQMLRALTGQAQIIAVPRLFVQFFDGQLDWAAMLSQLLYWSDKNLDDEGFFCKPDKELTAEVGIKQWSATACRKWLKAHEIIETKLKRVNGTPMLHYRLSDEGMARLVARLVQYIEQGVTAEPQARTDPYFEGVADACRMRPAENDWAQLSPDERGMINRAAGQLRKMKEPPELIPGFADYFADQDWRGQKGQAARPPDVTRDWSGYKKWLAGKPVNRKPLNAGLAALGLEER